MRKALHRSLAVAFAAAWWVSAGAAPPAGRLAVPQATGAISGVATTTEGQNLANVTLQLRDLGTGQVVGSTTTTATGEFSFVALNPANYAIEVLNVAAEVVAASGSVTVATGAVVSGITVTAPAALVGAAAAGGAAAGAAAGGAGAAAGGAGAAVSTAVTVTTAAAAAGVAGAVAAATQPPASPSR